MLRYLDDIVFYIRRTGSVSGCKLWAGRAVPADARWPHAQLRVPHLVPQLRRPRGIPPAMRERRAGLPRRL